MRGTFDDCQRMVKEAFADAELRKRLESWRAEADERRRAEDADAQAAAAAAEKLK